MTIVLTAAMIKRLKGDPTKRIELSDAHLPALRLVIQPNGSKSYAIRFKQLGQAKKFTIGAEADYTLAEARDAARAALSQARKGDNLTGAKQAARQMKVAAARATNDLVENALEDFFQRHVATLKSAPHVMRLLKCELRPWQGRRVQEITKRDVIDLIKHVHTRGAPTTSRRLLANVKKFFSWLIQNDFVQQSPCVSVRAITKEVERDRVLSDREVRAVFRAADSMGYPFGLMIKILALTGARRGEVAGMRWKELELTSDSSMWCIPGSRTKNKRPLDVPLSQPVLEILSQIPRIKHGLGAPVFVFTTTGETPVSGFSKAKATLDQKILDSIDINENSETEKMLFSDDMPEWNIHDLRRTFATGCAMLGIRPEIIEKCLNHKSGTFKGIVGVYQRHEYFAERRDAFFRWATHVQAITT